MMSDGDFTDTRRSAQQRPKILNCKIVPCIDSDIESLCLFNQGYDVIQGLASTFCMVASIRLSVNFDTVGAHCGSLLSTTGFGIYKHGYPYSRCFEIRNHWSKHEPVPVKVPAAMACYFSWGYRDECALMWLAGQNEVEKVFPQVAFKIDFGLCAESLCHSKCVISGDVPLRRVARR